MSKIESPEWMFYNNKGDSLAIAFVGGDLQIKTAQKMMLLYPDVLFERKGKIGHYLKRFLGEPKHPVLFNRWFLSKLEQQSPEWKKQIEFWKQEALKEKQWRLLVKKEREEAKNAPLSDWAKEQIERLRKLELAYPTERLEALKEFELIIKKIREVNEKLEPLYYKYFVTKEPGKKTVGMTKLGMVGRALNTSLSVNYISTAAAWLEDVITSLRGETNWEEKFKGR